MPEKKLYDLTVDPEFRDLIPPLNEEELKLLEESLVADGCESPLIVWNGVIVDGHNRYAICRKHEIPFAIQEKNFSSYEAQVKHYTEYIKSKEASDNWQFVDVYTDKGINLTEVVETRSIVKTENGAEANGTIIDMDSLS